MSRIVFPAMWGKFGIDTIWEDGSWSFDVYKIVSKTKTRPSTLDEASTSTRGLGIRSGEELRTHLINMYTKAVTAYCLLTELLDPQSK